MSNQEAQENGNGGTPESAAEITLNFEPQTEDQLIDFAKWLKTREHHSVVNLRWYLGHKIDGSGDLVYGQDTAGRIAEEVGYSKSTVHKSLKFAREYSNDQLASLLNGPFSLSWRDVAQNLSVAPEDFLRTYHDSENLEQFRNAVTQLRPTRNQNPRPPRKTRVELETENTELQNRVSELETENATLQQRIKELEGQQEASEALPDSVEETKESAEDLAKLIRLKSAPGKPGKATCPECSAKFEVDDRLECVFINPDKLRLPMAVNGTVCGVCGLVQGAEVDRCGYCGAELNTDL